MDTVKEKQESLKSSRKSLRKECENAQKRVLVLLNDLRKLLSRNGHTES